MSADKEFFAQRGFGQTIGFGKRPALLVIDMIQAFTHPEAMLGANLDAQIEAQINPPLTPQSFPLPWAPAVPPASDLSAPVN